MRRDGCSGARSLLAGAFAVVAPRPAAGPTLTFLKLLLGSANAAFSGQLLVCILDPADELVARERRDVLPGSERRRVGDQRFAQVFRKFVHHPTGHSLAAHQTTLAGILAARGPRRADDLDVGEAEEVVVLADLHDGEFSSRAPSFARAIRVP